MEVNIMDMFHKHTAKDVIGTDQHAELINGIIVVENKTTVSHNIAVSEIATSLKNFISSNNGTCKVFSENVALYVNELCNDDQNFFLPDVMVVCEDKGIKEDGVHTAPIFVAEVTSESTKKVDYYDKFEIYRKIGVKEYWIVDLQKKVVQKYLSDEDYIPQTYMHPESMKVTVYPKLMIDLSMVMSN